MCRTLDDIFNDNPSVRVLIIQDFDDGGAYGVIGDGTSLKIGNNEGFARRLSELEGAFSDDGHLTEERYRIRITDRQEGKLEATVWKEEENPRVI